MGVASGCVEQEVGVASGSGWNLWVWLLGVVVRRYIDFLILLIPTPLVSVLFYSSIPTFCSFFKMFFVLVYVHVCIDVYMYRKSRNFGWELILALLAVPFQSAKIYSTLIVYSAHAQKIVALVYSRAAFSPSAQLDSERSWSCELRGCRY